MRRYVSRQHNVDAIQFLRPSNDHEEFWLGNAEVHGVRRSHVHDTGYELVSDCLIPVRDGDWIVTHEDGTREALSTPVFMARYEPA